MGFLSEKVSYLKGLAEGMKIDEGTNEGKLLRAIIDVLDDFALAVEDIEEVQEALSQQVDEIDESLADVESVVFDMDEDDENYECDTEIECPYCNETICLEDSELDEEGTIECPNCHREFDFKWECNCGSESDHDEQEKQ